MNDVFLLPEMVYKIMKVLAILYYAFSRFGQNLQKCVLET